MDSGEIDQVKEWLWRYRESKKDLRRLEEEFAELVEMQESTGAIQYSESQIQPNSDIPGNKKRN